MRFSRPRLLLATIVSASLGPISILAAAPPATVFNRDIKPVLSENCYPCHGPDPGTRKAGLRLDTREGLFESTAKRGPAVTPGHPDQSELWKRISSDDPDDLMPPPASHKELKQAQKDLLDRWITDGASWQPHWAFVKPVRPPAPDSVPSGDSPGGSQIRNPIDAFVLARLRTVGLAPSPEADRRRLARRLALDLTGLPPAPAQVESFVADPSPDAYDRLVRKLMSSPQWGEHRARYWLDAARYADTHGLHFDNYREMWPYRDWVTRAFNRNLPFDRFTIEQMAGDLLPHPSDDQLIATGFHRCNATTNEGGTIEEENLVNYANDRVTTTAWVWLGLTANCAACHDHKFDPITTRDFYSLAAFFRNTTQTGFDGNLKDGANAALTVIDDPEDRARWTALPEGIARARDLVEHRRKAEEKPFALWAQSLTPEEVERRLRDDLLLQAPLNEGHGTTIRGETQGGTALYATGGETRWVGTGPLGPALRFVTDGTVDFGESGDFDLGQPFSFGGWVYVPSAFDETASIIARMDVAAGHRGWDLWIQQGQFAAHFVHQWPDDALKVRTRKRLVRKGGWQHVLVTSDGSGKPEGVKFYVDGAAAETETDGPSRVRGTLRTSTPLRIGRRSSGAPFIGGAVQDLRIYDRVLAGPEVRALARMGDLASLLATPFAEWQAEAHQEVFDFFLLSQLPYQDARKALAGLEDERESIRLRYPVTHVQREKPDANPMAAVLFRGQYDKPKESLGAATPAVLHPMPADAPPNRLGLALWLVAPDNPLVARVTVNRFWQEIFGVGLVRTTEDFGIMGESPVHPELLDWLAVEFMESGWNVRHIFELIVTSSTYRQSEAATPDKLEKDPSNRLLSRGPRFRLDAEVIRDGALELAGLLDRSIGGPSVKPYQPDGVWEAVAMPESDTREYRRDSGAALYRRSLYTFWKRSAPPALLDLFNAPSRETCTVRRERTNTPLQALATLNDPQFVEAARVLAEHALTEAGADADAALDQMARRVLSRPLQSRERQEISMALTEFERFYDRQPGEADRLLAVGESPPDPTLAPPRLAAWTLVANQLLNLDETLCK